MTKNLNFKFTISRFCLGAWRPFLLTHQIVEVPEGDSSEWPFTSVRRNQNLRGIEIVLSVMVVWAVIFVQTPIFHLTHLALWLACRSKTYEALTVEYRAMEAAARSVANDRFWRAQEIEI